MIKLYDMNRNLVIMEFKNNFHMLNRHGQQERYER